MNHPLKPPMGIKPISLSSGLGVRRSRRSVFNICKMPGFDRLVLFVRDSECEDNSEFSCDSVVATSSGYVAADSSDSALATSCGYVAATSCGSVAATSCGYIAATCSGCALTTCSGYVAATSFGYGLL
ncbi:hypothetical protein DPMN_049876 [Dreissena polymorpha]|uniref:Uncharacterized protein n=1 Tax=Dreissena polymorpha TaxID=45954 RepID=A0A9D4HLQ3_DREPO|nr:hypothetical protein DPMN_049876 [Dreissena polymorpha]